MVTVWILISDVVFCTYMFTDVFHTGIWEELHTVKDQHLQDLASKLPLLALQAKQGGTVKNYTYGWSRWRRWAALYPEVQAFPASPMYVAIYLLEIYQSARTAAPVSLAAYSIAWAHKTAGLADPTLHALPRMIKEAAPRTLKHFSNKKDPLTVEMIEKIVHKYGSCNASLQDLRLLAMFLVAFTAFLRYSELSNLRYCDIQFEPDHMRLFVEHSKTDVYRDGVWVYVARLISANCPVAALERYVHRAGFDEYSEKFIFRGITRNKCLSKRKLKTTNAPLSYSTARSLILNALGVLGYDINQFGTHSLRAGGATAAAANRVEDRLFKKHGRWRSDRSKDRYVTEDLAQKLKVTQSLGL